MRERERESIWTISGGNDEETVAWKSNQADITYTDFR